MRMALLEKITHVTSLQLFGTMNVYTTEACVNPSKCFSVQVNTGLLGAQYEK